MGRHAVQRLLMAIPVLFGVMLVGFLLMQVVPNDPALVRAAGRGWHGVSTIRGHGNEPNLVATCS